jgi:hypothetical protein
VADTTLETQYRRAMAEIERQHMPLSTTPVAVDWPITGEDALSQPTATHYNQFDNSV